MILLAGLAHADAPVLRARDLETWRKEVAAASGDPARFAEAVRRIAPSFQPADAPFARADVFSGQLDDDAALEWVVQVIQAPEAAGSNGERVEVGARPGGASLANLVIHGRTAVSGCDLPVETVLSWTGASWEQRAYCARDGAWDDSCGERPPACD